MKKFFSLFITFWGPVLMFFIGLATLPIGVGLAIWLISFVVMPFVVIIHAGENYGGKMALLAFSAILIPVMAVALNINLGWVSASVPDLPLGTYHYDEYFIEAKVVGMLATLAAVQPIVYVLLLRDQKISTIIACVLCIFIWLFGIYVFFAITAFPHLQ